MKSKMFEAYAELIQQIFDAQLSPDKWTSVLEKSGVINGSVGNHILMFDKSFEPTFGVIHSRYGAEFAKNAHDIYIREYAVEDRLRATNILKSANGRAYNYNELISGNDVKKSRLHNEYNRSFECERQLIFGDKLSNSSYISICGSRSIADKEYTDEELFLFNSICNSMSQSLKLRTKVDSLFGHNATLDSIIHSNEHEVFVISPKGTIIWTNDKAEKLLCSSKSLSSFSGILKARDNIFNSHLDRLLKQAFKLSNAGRSRSGFTVLREGHADYQVSIFSTELQAAFVTDLREVAVVALKKVELLKPPHPNLLAAYYQLTPAEAKLAVALARGLTLSNYALNNKLTIDTVRSTLKVVLQKTDCHRQSQLIIKIGALRP